MISISRPTNSNSRGQWILTGASMIMLCGMLFFTYRLSVSATPTAKPVDPLHYSKPIELGTDMEQLVSHLWKPYLHNVNDTKFTTSEGYKYEIAAGNHRWTQPLGKKVLILDVDSRYDTSQGALLNEDPLRFDNMTGRTGGMLNHYLYALIHGYDYRFIRAPEYKERHGTWVKVPMIREALKTHDFVVFLDADAEFMYPHMPIEWLMSLWNITPNTSIALASDPDSPNNRDEKGWVYWNTGFIIAQQSKKTQEIMNAWDHCPDGQHYKGCERWAKDWAHEQAAFGNYVRYEFDHEKDLRVIPCMDGNGAPYIGDKTCGGVFIRHHWFRKDLPAKDLHALILDMFVRRLHRHFHDEKDRYFLDAQQYVYGSEEGLRV